MTLALEQAFTADFIAQGFGLPIAHENDDYTPTAGTPFVEIKMFPNDASAHDLDARNVTDGFFQFILRYPQGTGAIAAKQMREDIFSAYPVGRSLSYGGATATVNRVQPLSAMPDDGWFEVIGRIFYRAVVAR